MKKGELYVITGPLFIGRNLERLNGRVLVPTHIYKLVFDPGKNMGAAYFVRNEPGMEMQVISIAQLEKIAGINFFPSLSDAEKGRVLKLPVPKVLR
jgi:endonuclease G